MPSNIATGLNGIRVLVTRPARQAQALCNAIETLGGEVLRLPVIEISDPSDIRPALKIINKLDRFAIAIFISANAVEMTHALITARGAWPATLKIAAVGKRTAAALQHLGKHVDLMPQHGSDSEALLSLAELQDVAGKDIVIFRGEGGRELLADTLRQRGAHVEYAEVYRRMKPDVDASAVQQAGEAGKIHIITITSNESLLNLCDMVGGRGRHWLHKTPLVVISQRTAELAREMGFKTVIIANHTSDEGLVDAIKEWYAIHHTTIKQ